MSKNKHLPWFRLYHEAIDDPKLKLLPFAYRWHYVGILCCKAQGVLDTAKPELMLRMIGAKLELSQQELSEVIHSLSEVGLIDPETVQPLAWDERQFQSDNSTKRVQEYRKRQQKQPCNEMKRYSNGLVTVQDTDTDTDKDTEIKKPMSSSDELNSGEAGEVFAYWRQAMNHPKAKMDEKRKRKIRARLKDGYTVGDLMLAIDGCKKSPHHMGQNDRATVYDDIELICRDAPHVDKFINLAKQPDMTGLSGAGRRTAQVARDWINETA